MEATQQAPQPAEEAEGDRAASRPQTIRQRARHQAREASARRRAQRAREEKRLGEHATTILTALGERDALIAETEHRAGAALLAMTRDEGLSLRSALEWCGEDLGIREATRLRRLAEDAARVGTDSMSGTGSHVTAAAAPMD